MLGDFTHTQLVFRMWMGFPPVKYSSSNLWFSHGWSRPDWESQL